MGKRYLQHDAKICSKFLAADNNTHTLNTARLTAGAIALLYDFDVDTAASEALVAVENNATFIDKKNEVKKVVLNGDKGIHQWNFKNDKCVDNPIKIGESMFEDAFISPDTGLAVGQVFIGESIGCLEKYHLKKTANAIFFMSEFGHLSLYGFSYLYIFQLKTDNYSRYQ